MKPPSEADRSRYKIEALTRGLQVLTLFSLEKEALSLTDVVEAMDLNKSTAFRLLATLESEGYLERDPSTRLYRPGLAVLRLGFAALSGLELPQVARPYIEKLALDLNETASLAVLDRSDIVYVDRVRNRAIVGVVLGIGSRLPAHCTSMGKVLLAGLEQQKLKDLLSHLELKRFTPNTIVDVEQLLRELDDVRERGYAINNEELAAGLRTVAAPVRDGTQRVVASVNVSGPTTTISYDRLVDEIRPLVMDTGLHISVSLGYQQRERIDGYERRATV